MSTLVYKRPRSPFWYITKTRSSTKTTNKRDAEEMARKVVQAEWRKESLGEETHTWEDLATHWLDIKAHKKSIVDDRRIIKDASRFFAGKELGDLTATLVAKFGKAVKVRASGPTANRSLTVVRSMLRKAADLDWIVKCPVIEMYPENAVEPIWHELATVGAVLVRLPPWVAVMAELALQTGMRWGNVRRLQWEWVDLVSGVLVVPMGYTKSKKTYVIPLSTVAKALLTRLEAGRTGSPFVFHQEDGVTPVKQVKVQWRRAVKEAGLEGFKWHHMRHVWASHHIVNGTPDRIVQAAGGWSSPAMLQKYGHLKTQHLQTWANNLNAREKTPGG